MFINGQVLDCSTNFQLHERNQKKERPDEKISIGYDPKDPAFISICEAVILGTYTIFNYDPTDDEAKQLLARMKGVPVATLEKVTLTPHELREMKARLRMAEAKMLNIYRHCKGDASETGLVQFVDSVISVDQLR